MKVGEILRLIADQVDADDADQAAHELTQQSNVESERANSLAQQAANDAMAQCNDLAPDQIEIQISNDDATEHETMVSPLQQKHELLKKAGGVENNVSEFAEDEAEGDDELAMMKKMAGIGQNTGPTDYADTTRQVEINPRKNAAMAHFASDDYSNE